MTPEQQRRAQMLVDLYTNGDVMADPLAHALSAIGDLAHRAAVAAHVNGPATAIAHASEGPGSVALKIAQELHQTNNDLGTTIRGVPTGIGALAKAGYLDYRDALHNVSAAHQRPSFAHTGPLLREMEQGITSDVTHPLRHPGYTLLDALVAAGGIGASARTVGVAGRAAADAGRVADAASAAGRASALPRAAAQVGAVARTALPLESRIGSGIASRLSAARTAMDVPAGASWTDALHAVGNGYRELLRPPNLSITKGWKDLLPIPGPVAAVGAARAATKVSRIARAPAPGQSIAAAASGWTPGTPATSPATLGESMYMPAELAARLGLRAQALPAGGPR